MAEIVRSSHISNEIEKLFDGLFVRPLHLHVEPTQPLAMRLDVEENENSYVVHAELPGVKKDDIHVHIDGNRVSLRAQVLKETEQKKGTNILRRERQYGELVRSFVLDQDVDSTAARASYHDGVLQLTLPKKTKSMAKIIPVN